MNGFNHEKRDFFKSDGEEKFSWFLDDLIDGGYVEDWEYESEVFSLSDPYKIPWKEQLKTKVKDRSFSVLEKCTYEPDFKIVWSEKAKGVFYHNIGDEISDPKTLPYFYAQDNISRIEIKPPHDFQNKTAQAVIKIKWLRTLGTFVQLVIPVPKVDKKGAVRPKNATFYSLFIPERFKYTDKSGRARKINFEHKTLKEWEDTRR